MSDIPIGSPPAPPGRHAAPRGWYPDPVDGSRERYWDGWGWSRNTRQAELPGPTPGPAGGQQQAPGPQQPGYHQQGHQQPYGSQHYGAGGQQPAYAHYRQSAPATSGPQTADGVPLAGWGFRFLAGLLDLIIVSIGSSILALPVTLQSLPAISRYVDEVMTATQSGQIAPTLSPNDLMSTNQQMLVSLITVVAGLLYFILFWRFKSATLGHLACGLRVVQDGQGHGRERLSWTQVTVRALIWSLPFTIGYAMLWLFGLLNALFPLWNVKRQAIHDIAAKTQIVRIR